MLCADRAGTSDVFPIGVAERLLGWHFPNLLVAYFHFPLEVQPPS